MKRLAPAKVVSEPSTVAGLPFLAAIDHPGGCLWPLGGSGAELVVCGEARIAGTRYCDEHLGRVYAGTPQNPR